MTSHPSQSAMVSLSVHAGAIALLLLLSRQLTTNAFPPLASTATVPLIAPRLKIMIGGGGGQHQSMPASEGHLPKIGPQFVPPMQVVPRPKLAMEASIEAPPEVMLMNRDLPNMGDPLSRFTGSSAGTGGPSGLGNGPGTGIGDKHGPAVGAGDSPQGMVYSPGRGITMPILITKVEPEFSDEARKAKHSGTVKVRIDVDTNGHARNIRVLQTLGMGLDEKAVEAVSKWLFKPGTKDGKPVPVTALVEVTFHLL